MIGVDLIGEIRRAFFEQRWPIKEILRTLSVSRTTVRRVVRGQKKTEFKPAGTTSKLFGLTEGAHLPARRQFLRWVQFKGTKNATGGGWDSDSDPLLHEYESRGYPMRVLRTFSGMSIVGFPTLPRIQRLGIGERLVTAPEAAPAQQYRWLLACCPEQPGTRQILLQSAVCSLYY